MLVITTTTVFSSNQRYALHLMNNPQLSKKNFLFCFSCCWLSESERQGNLNKWKIQSNKHGYYQLKLPENKGKTGHLFIKCWHLLIFCHQKIDKAIYSPIINIIQIDGPASINVHACMRACVRARVCDFLCSVCVCAHLCNLQLHWQHALTCQTAVVPEHFLSLE